jgi:PAS domain S-box-containing protein
MKKIGPTNRGQIKGQLDVSFRMLAEMSPAGIHITDENGNCIYVNPAWCRMAGITCDEALGEGWIKAIHKEDLGRLISEWKIFMRGESHWESEYRFMDATGKVTWVYGTATLLKGRDGSVEQIIGLIINMNERKKYENELKESEERLRLASESTGFGTYSYEFESGIAYYSKEFLDLYGLSQGETLKLDGDLVAEALHPDDKKKFLSEMLKANDPLGSGILDTEYRILRTDGTEKWLRTRGLTIFSGNNITDKPLRATGIVQDITERKKINEKLLESEKRYRNLVEQSPIGIGIYQNGQFVFINETGLNIMGCKDRKDILGKPVLSFVHPESQSEVIRRMQIVAGGIAVAPLEERLIRFDGTVFYAEVTSVSTIFNEKPAGQILVKDISDRKKAEKELLESNSKYRLLSEHSGIGIGLFSPEGKILFFNEQALKNLGGISQEYTGKKLTEVFGETTGNELIERIKDTIKTGENYVYEDPIETSKGTSWFLSNFTRICDPDERVIGVQVVSQDITELKRIETALKQASAYNRSLIEASLDPMITIGSDGRILDVNKATEDVTGYSRIKLIGTDFSAYFTDPAWAQSGYQAVFSKGFVRDYLLEIKNKKGQVIPVLYNATLYRDEEGKVIGVFAAARDISELKKVEDALKKKEANLRSLIENSDWSIWSINRNFELIDANSTFIENFKTGTGRSIHVGDNVIDGLPAALKEDWIRYYKRCLEGEHFNILVTTIPPVKTSSMRYSFNPIRTEESDVIGLTITGQNISDLKRTEEKLKQSANELRKLSRHVEDLMETEKTQIAHDLHDDLGQKLTALNMDIAWLKSRIGVQSRPVENKMLGMSQLLNDSFESLRKISYGLRPSILDNLGLYPAIEWQLSEFKKTTGINYSLSFVPKEKSIDNKISLVVFRIIQESLTNIARHSHATKVIVKLKVDDKKLNLIVRDNGIGIDGEKLKKRDSFGLLGMKERARSYGGEVTIKGKPGEGTVLELEIPVDVMQ